MQELGIRAGAFLLPAPGVDPAVWACVACDQFTSQPEYWRQAEALAAGQPSALGLILPEAYLSEAQARVPGIHRAMEQALASGTVATAVENGFILVERTVSTGTRLGLVALIDLEAYDYAPGSRSLVRATEDTIVERIPPRLAVRRGAALEMSHVLLLIDDPARTVLEPLLARSHTLTPLYDFALMLGGGRLRGYAVTDPADIGAVYAALGALRDTARDGLLYAVGDGNHSLATAKALWEELKPGVPESERANHPARYAMVEVENIHDPALAFEPIHRVLFGADGDDLLPEMEAYAVARGWTLADGPEGQPVTVVYEGKSVDLSILGSSHPLAVGTVQAFLDDWLAAHPGHRLDYVHGEAVARALSQGERTVAFLLPALDKAQLFPAVEKLGALPRKTFSMGEANEKRYYMEARRLTR